MKSIFRATAILSGSSIASIVVSLVTAKVMALWLQPVGYGYYGLLQNFVLIGSLMTGLGMATGIVRTGAAAVEQQDVQVVAALRRASTLLFWALAAVTVVLVAIFRNWLSLWVLGSRLHGSTIVLMTVPLILTVARNIHMGILNAHHAVTALAKCTLFTSICVAIAITPVVIMWGPRGIIPAVVIDAIVSFGVYRYFFQRAVGPVAALATLGDTARVAWALMRFGGPYTVSMIMGTGIQLALPILVLHLLGGASVGYYRAACGISVGYLGFLLAAMQQDYYPRVSAAASQPDRIVHLINEQHRLVMLIAIPVILFGLALVPYLVPLIYSRNFVPAVEILEWQMIGDLFRFSGWTMSCAILARCGAPKYLLTETISGVASLACTWLWVRWCGLSGLGIGFLATYVIYFLSVGLIARRELSLKWSAFNKRAMLTGAAAALFIRIVPSTRLAAFRMPIALALAVALTLCSLLIVWREMRSSRQEPVHAF